MTGDYVFRWPGITSRLARLRGKLHHHFGILEFVPIFLDQIIGKGCEIFFAKSDNQELSHKNIVNVSGFITQLNRPLYDEDGVMYDVLVGTFLVVGLTKDDFGSLTDKMIEKYTEVFSRGFVI